MLHARWADAKRGLAQAETMLAEANAASEAGASQAARAEKSALLTEDAVQPLRDEAMVAEAVVQRLRIDHQALERDAAQARAELNRLTAERQRNAADRSRETQGLDDAASMLAGFRWIWPRGKRDRRNPRAPARVAASAYRRQRRPRPS